jgi:hypothetical protein
MRQLSKALPKDPNQLAHEIVRLSTEETEKTEQPTGESAISEYSAKIGRKGGLKGGKARADKLTATQRRKIAIKAAHARWKKSTASVVGNFQN